MPPHHLGDLFHRFDARSHGGLTPLFEKLVSLSRTFLAPESLDFLFEQIRLDTL